MRWSWVLLAASPCGSAGAKEHPNPSTAAASNAASATASLSNPGVTAVATACSATALLASIITPAMFIDALSAAAVVDAARVEAVFTPAYGLEVLERINLEGVASKHARAGGADDDPGA